MNAVVYMAIMQLQYATPGACQPDSQVAIDLRILLKIVGATFAKTASEPISSMPTTMVWMTLSFPSTSLKARPFDLLGGQPD